jgi:hypothetical protein
MCAVGRVPPAERSILPDAAPVEIPMSGLILVSALCVVFAIAAPVLTRLFGRSGA